MTTLNNLYTIRKPTFPFFTFVFTDTLEFKKLREMDSPRMKIPAKQAVALSGFLLYAVQKELQSRLQTTVMLKKNSERAYEKVISEIEKPRYIDAEDEEEAIDEVERFIYDAEDKIAEKELSLKIAESQELELRLLIDKIEKLIKEVEGLINEF